MSNLRYAIWYEPTGLVYKELEVVIQQLASKYQTPIFEPHITLLPGGTDLDKDQTLGVLQEIASKTKPFSTTFDSFGYLDEYFKCLFIKVKQTSEVMDFAHNIQNRINGHPNNNFIPHLSILYGQFSNDKKTEIITSLGKTYTKSFILEKINVIEYELEKPPETWKKVASIYIK